jgi:hypothetical protein
MSTEQRAIDKIESKIVRLAFDKASLKKQLEKELQDGDDMFIEFALANLSNCNRELEIYTYILKKIKE